MFKDINVYSLGSGAFIIILAGYFQSSPPILGITLYAFCIAVAVFLLVKPLLNEIAEHQKKAALVTGYSKENENLLYSILAETSQAIIMLDEQQNILSSNPSAETLFGFNAWDVIGKKVDILFKIEASKIKTEQVITQKSDHSSCNIRIRFKDIPVSQGYVTICFIDQETHDELAHDEFQQSPKFQELVLNNIPESIYVKDKDRNIVFANNMFLNMFPDNIRSEIIGGKTTNYCDVQYIAAIQNQDRLALETGYHETEEDISYPWRGRKTLQTKKVRFTDTHGEQYILGISKDISDLKDKERQVKESDNRLALAIECGGLGFWDWNIEEETIDFSDGWLNMLGYQRKDLSGNLETWISLIHPDDQENVKEKLNDFLSGKQRDFESKIRMQHKCGTWHSILSRGKIFKFDDTGNPVKAVGTQMDITDQLTQQGRVDFLMNLIILSNESDNQETFLRSALATICKYIGWPVGHAFILDEENETYKSSRCWYVKENDIDVSEFRSVTEDGNFSLHEDLPGIVAAKTGPEWVENIAIDNRISRVKSLTNNPLKSAFSFPIQIYGRTFVILEFFTTEDVEEENEMFVLWGAAATQIGRAIERYINERRREEHLENIKAAEKKAKAAEKSANMANRMKSEFLTNMSHEIRTPLNGIIGAADLLKRISINKNQRKYLDVIHHSGDTLLLLINDVLDLSKIEAGELEIIPEPVDIRKFIKNTLHSISPKADNKAVELACYISEDVPDEIMADEIRLKQVMINLLGNAIKFVDKGYIAVSVTAVNLENCRVELNFSVKDTGIGIPDDKLNSIFEKFSQVDATTTKKYGGTGLGLTITQKLIAMMEGEIGVKSQINMGTEFWFRITVPVIQPHKKLYLSPILSLPKKLKILVIDDTEISRKFLSDTLNDMGISCRTASSADKGLALLQDASNNGEPYDILLLDCELIEDKSAFTAETVRTTPELSHIKIIFLSTSGKFEPETLQSQHYHGSLFDDYLVKPVSHQNLMDKILDAISNKKAIEIKEITSTQDDIEMTIDANILLVENELVNQMVATDMLENLGCSVTIAENGQDAIDILYKEGPFDVVLMDCMMPLMDGFKATEHIRKNEVQDQRPHQLIIAMTANAMTGEREKCIASGMDDYLSKPVKENDLFAKLKEYIH